MQMRQMLSENIAKQLSSRRHHLVNPVQYRAKHFIREKVGRIPEQDHIEATTGNIQVSSNKPVNVESTRTAVFRSDDPIALRGIFYEVRQVDAVSKGCDEVNIR